MTDRGPQPDARRPRRRRRPSLPVRSLRARAVRGDRRSGRRSRRRAAPCGPVLDGDAHHPGARLPDAGAALGAEVALPGRRLAGQHPVHAVLLHRRPRALLRGGAQRGQGPLSRPPGRIPRGHRLLHGRHRPAGARRRRRAARHQPGPVVLQPQRAGARRDRGRHGRGDHRAAPATTLGRGDVRPVPRAAADRHRQLGPAGHRVRRVRRAGLGAPTSDPRRCAPRPRRGGEDVAVVHPRPDPRARRAHRAMAGRADHHRHRRRDAGARQPAGRARLPGQLAAVLPAQRRAADRLGDALVHRSLPRRPGHARQPGAVPVAERQRLLAQHAVVRAVRAGVPRHRRARVVRTAPAPAGRSSRSSSWRPS